MHTLRLISTGADAPDGMLDTRGHRKAVMSMDGAFTKVGLALVPSDRDRQRRPAGGEQVTMPIEMKASPA